MQIKTLSFTNVTLYGAIKVTNLIKTDGFIFKSISTDNVTRFLVEIPPFQRSRSVDSKPQTYMKNDLR
jgi:hypothetical protein